MRGRAGPSRGRARPFAHCKRTKGQISGQKRPRIWSTSGGSLGRGRARPSFTVNARRAGPRPNAVPKFDFDPESVRARHRQCPQLYCCDPLSARARPQIIVCLHAERHYDELLKVRPGRALHCKRTKLRGQKAGPAPHCKRGLRLQKVDFRKCKLDLKRLKSMQIKIWMSKLYNAFNTNTNRLLN